MPFNGLVRYLRQVLAFIQPLVHQGDGVDAHQAFLEDGVERLVFRIVDLQQAGNNSQVIFNAMMDLLDKNILLVK